MELVFLLKDKYNEDNKMIMALIINESIDLSIY